jgi:hypothetical protein
LREINKIAQKHWEDYDVEYELDMKDASVHSYDYIFVMRDEHGKVAGFRSAVWNEVIGAWIFENGVVREQGNALGSNLLHLIVDFFIKKYPRDCDCFANVENKNESNLRQYQVEFFVLELPLL